MDPLRLRRATDAVSLFSESVIYLFPNARFYNRLLFTGVYISLIGNLPHIEYVFKQPL